jgi:hypothetical protein
MPTDRLTIRSTIRDNSPNEKIAAAEMLNTPEIVVASKIEISAELLILFSPLATQLQLRSKLDHRPPFSANQPVNKCRAWP